MKISGQVAVVTGASSGIGAVVCRALASRDARVAMLARTPETLDRARMELGDLAKRCRTFPCDVGNREAVQRTMKRVSRVLGVPSILVNNAGIAAYSAFAAMDPAEMERMVRTNLLGALYCARAVVSGMRAARRGAIVNVGSIAGLIPVPHMSVYSATKWGVTGLSESLNAELSREGIHVGVVCPFIVDTPLVARQEARGGRAIPHALTLKPETVARAVIEVIEKERDLIVLPRSLGAVAAAQMSTGPMLRWTLRRTAAFFKPRAAAPRGKRR